MLTKRFLAYVRAYYSACCAFFRPFLLLSCCWQPFFATPEVATGFEQQLQELAAHLAEGQPGARSVWLHGTGVQSPCCLPVKG